MTEREASRQAEAERADKAWRADREADPQVLAHRHRYEQGFEIWPWPKGDHQ